ncbi:CPBP family glutamic-type intramembrane protease [Nocardia sp. NPDC047648]|uniref:CPBP family glutamic-type intramembrane protease n=1 Tax=Nocardia sp. NPDC047648 TaxID=3155625 RepID=UPI003410D727
MREALWRQPIPARTAQFFVLAYALTWLVWLPMLFAPDRLQILHYLGSLGPLVAAFVMRSRTGGAPAVRELLSQMGRWRVPWRWWLFAIGFPLALFAAGALVSALIGDPVDWSQFLGSKEYADVGIWLIATEILFFGYGEETGWRGYAIPSLERAGWTSYAATTLFAVAWAGWHAPLFFYPHGLATMPLLMIPGWLVSILFGAYLTTFLFNNARASILIVAVFHGMVDIVSISRAATDVTLIVVNAGLIAAAVLVAIRWSPTLRTSAAGAGPSSAVHDSQDPRLGR